MAFFVTVAFSFTRSHLVAKDLFAILDEVNDESRQSEDHCLSQAWPVVRRGPRRPPSSNTKEVGE